MRTPQLRLYQITDVHNGRHVPGTPYFASKPLAKIARHELNGDPEKLPLRYVVSPGPDHKNYVRSYS